MLTIIYASRGARERRVLWNDLFSLNSLNNWILLGDYNVVASQEEKIGGNLININYVNEFNEMIHSCRPT